MSLMVFLSICVLACDFLILMFFRWTLGEKYRGRKRRVTAGKKAAAGRTSHPYFG